MGDLLKGFFGGAKPSVGAVPSGDAGRLHVFFCDDLDDLDEEE